MRSLDSLRSLEMTEGGFPIWPGSPPAEHPDEKYYIFGKEGGVRMAEKYGIQLLGQIPIVQSIRECGDAGEPATLSSRPDGLAFLALAEKLASTLY